VILSCHLDTWVQKSELGFDVKVINVQTYIK
jgi:hypothetical protein